MGGKSKEPTVTQVPTKSPQQTQFLNSLLGMMGGYMGPESIGQMPTLGERYAGGRPAPSAGGGKGGTAPGRTQMRQPASPSATQALTGPIVSPFTRGQTGNYPRRTPISGQGGKGG